MQDIRSKAVTIDDSSSLFTTFTTTVYSHYSRLFAMRYSLYATIHYSLFGFSKHPLVLLDQFQLESLHFIDSVNFGHVVTENIQYHILSHRLKYFGLKHLPHPSDLAIPV